MNLIVNSSVKKLVIIFFFILLFSPQFSVFVLKIDICFIHYFSQVLLMVLITGFGVFTKTDIEKGEFILEYSGERITIQEVRKEKKEGKENIAICFIFNGMD